MRSSIFILLAVLAWVMGGAAILADSLPGAGAPALAGADRAGHAWVCVPLRSDGPGLAVLHLPPRDEESPEGSAQVVMTLPGPDAPERLAAWESKLYLAFRPERAAGVSQRRVLVLSVEQGPGGGWAVPNEGQNLPPLPALPGDGALAGLAGSVAGPAALIERGEGESLTSELLIDVGTAWQKFDLPDSARSARLLLVGSSDGLELVAPDLRRAWSGRFAGRSTLEWAIHPLSFQRLDGQPAPAPRDAGALMGESLVYWIRTGAGLQVWTATAEACYLAADLPRVGKACSVAPLTADGRLAVVWAETMPVKTQARPELVGAPKPPPQESWPHLLELSLYTGRVLYDGEARVNGPVSSQELKLLALVLAVVMAVILLFVLRPDRDGAPLTLPREVMLADPLRRVVAGAIDLFVAGTLAGQATSLSLGDLLSLTRLLTETTPLEGLVVTVGIGVIHCSLGEWLWGRSIGKAITGCEVVWPVIKAPEGQIRPVLRRPSLWRAVARNIIKWVLPPVAISGIFTPERRHGGDIVAGTVVISPVEDENDGNHEGEGFDDAGD